MSIHETRVIHERTPEPEEKWRELYLESQLLRSQLLAELQRIHGDTASAEAERELYEVVKGILESVSAQLGGRWDLLQNTYGAAHSLVGGTFPRESIPVMDTPDELILNAARSAYHKLRQLPISVSR